jgi:single-strand DNA-binding protein
MASVNKIILIGNVGKDPEMRYTPSGQAVTKFSLATTRKWKNNDGEPKSRTTWFNIEAWGRMAETLNEYVKKGSRLYVEGRLEVDEYDKDGEKKYFTKVVVGEFQFLSSRDSEEPEEELSEEQIPF